MIHLKMIGSGLLEIFKFIGDFILIVLWGVLITFLLVGWIVMFFESHFLIGCLILLIDLLIASYFIGDYMYRKSKKKAEKSSESNLEIGGEKNE